MRTWLQANFSKISVGLLLGVLGTAGALAVRDQLADDCCQPGASCCHPGASCCNGHHLARR